VSGGRGFRRGRWQWRLAPEALDRLPEFESLLQRPGADRKTVKTTDGRRAIWQAPLADGGAAFVKHYSRPRLVKQIKHLVRNSRTRQEFEMGTRLAALGLPVARHLAMAERRRCGLLQEDYLIEEALAGYRNFDAWFRERLERGGPAGERREAVRRLACLIRRMHDLGALQRDFKPDSVMVGPEGDFKLVDLERALVRRRLGLEARLANLAKLDQTFGFVGSAADRLRFLHQYFLPDNAPADRLEVYAREIARQAERLFRAEARDRRAWTDGDNELYKQYRLGPLRVTAHYELPRSLLEEVARNLDAAAGRDFRCVWKPGLPEVHFRASWCDARHALAHVPALYFRQAPFVPARAALYPPGSDSFGLLLLQRGEPTLLPVAEGARAAARPELFAAELGRFLRVLARMGIGWSELRPDCILCDPLEPDPRYRFFINRLDLLLLDLEPSPEEAARALSQVAELVGMPPEFDRALRAAYDACRLRWFRCPRRD
jgi:hypothetical protein